MPNPYRDAQQTPGILNKVAGATQNVNNRLKTFYKSMPQHAIGQLDDGLPRLAQYETDPIPSNYQQQSQFYNTLGDRVQHVDDLFQSSPIKVPRPYYFHDDRQVPSSRTVGTNGQLAPSSSKRTTMPSLHSTRQRASPYNAQRPSSTGEDQWGQYAGDQPSRTLFDSAAVAPRYGDFRQRPGSYKPADSLFRGQEKQPYQFEDNVRRSSSYNPFATPTMYRDHELGPPFYNPAVQQLPPNTYQSDEHQSEVSFALQPGNPQRAPPSGSPSHSIPQDLDPQTIRDQLSAPPNLSLHTPSRISPRHAALSLAKSNVNNRPPTSSIPTTDSLLSMLPNTQSSVLSDPSETADSSHSICGRSTFGPKVLLSCFSLLDPFDIPFRVLNATSSSPTSTAPAPGAKAAAAKTERDAKDDRPNGSSDQRRVEVIRKNNAKDRLYLINIENSFFFFLTFSTTRLIIGLLERSPMIENSAETFVGRITDIS
ncbi:unnamed protein product [Nesidiocoris tenuis]|uniref:Uncharacterized protein n=1 Tax=Nesidiocoris tenuis TaxID=355587 RepID=A0A6H5HCP9_9HEMI|nr:unnamed protein product [Nesidiocoris tenuis]